MKADTYRIVALVLALVQLGLLFAILMAVRPRRGVHGPARDPMRWESQKTTTTWPQESPPDAPTIPIVRRPAEPPPSPRSESDGS